MTDTPARDGETRSDERRAFIRFDDWAGRHESPCLVVSETRHGFRIRVEQRTRLAGRWRYLDPGETVLVPKRAIRFARPGEGDAAD